MSRKTYVTLVLILSLGALAMSGCAQLDKAADKTAAYTGGRPPATTQEAAVASGVAAAGALYPPVQIVAEILSVAALAYIAKRKRAEAVKG